MKFLIPAAIIICAAPAWAQNPVSISVFDESGKPIAGALVSVRVFNADETKVAPQKTDAKGKANFSMPNDKDGKPTIGGFLAGAKGYSFGGVMGGTMGVLKGENFSNLPLEIRLTPGQTWRGKVVDDKGKPLEGAKITIRGALKDRDYSSVMFLSEEETFRALYSAQSGADGSFEIPDLPADYNLLYNVTRPKFANVQGQDASVKVLELVKMSPAGALHGRALDVAGKPLADIKIYAGSANRGGGGVATTKSDGSFVIEGLTSGTYDLTAVLADKAAFILPRLTGIRIVAGQTATAAAWRAQTGAEIRGVVRDAVTKKPIANASFAAQNKDDIAKNNDSAWATSDKDGVFVLRVLPGQYKVRSSGGSTDFMRSEATQNVEAKDGAPTQINFTLQASPVVRGITRDESGKPIAAKILVGGFGGGPGISSNAQGKWEFKPSSTEDIGIGGGQDDDGYFEVISPKRVDWPVKGPIVVTVRRHAWQSLAGRVVTPDGAPLEGVKVEAEFNVQIDDSTSYGTRVSASSDKDGRYVLEKLRDSRRPDVMGTEVEVSAKKDGYQFKSGGKVTRENNEPRVSDLVFVPLSERISGLTLAGADVVVAGRQTLADDVGRFGFEALPAGKNIVYAAKGKLFGSAPSSQSPLEIKLAKLAPQKQDEQLAREIWNQATADKKDENTLDLDEWRRGEDFLTRLRSAQKSGEPWRIAYALGELKPTDTPEAQKIAREVLAEMQPSESRTGAYLSIATHSDDAALTDRALEMAGAQFDAATTDARTRERQLYQTAVLTERRDGVPAGAFALRTALAYTLQTHPEQSRVEGAMQTEVGRNEALADAASIVAQGSPALLSELIETIDAGSGFAIRARANAIPVVERAHGFEAAATLLEELRQMPEPTLDLKIRYTDFTPAWSYGQTVSNLIPIIGPTDADAALELARKVEGDDEQRGRALARAARFQSLAVAAPLLREAVEKISSEDAPRVAAAAYERDEKLGLELFEIARQKAEDDMKSNRNWRNSWIPFAFGYARANPAEARLILEREWAKSREAKADGDVLAATAIAMAPIDGKRATEMARELSGSWGRDAQIKIARYLVADDATRHGFVLNRIGSREGWDAGDLQW